MFSESISDDKVKDNIIENIDKKMTIGDRKRFLIYIMKDMKLDVKYEKVNNDCTLFQLSLASLSQDQIEHLSAVTDILIKKQEKIEDNKSIKEDIKGTKIEIKDNKRSII